MSLLTIDDYKLLEGINSAKNDDQLNTLLTSVSALIETYCGTKFLSYATSPGVTDIFDIQWDTHVVQLKHSPVIAITSVFERSSQSSSYVEIYKDGSNNEYSWFFDPISDSIFRTSESGGYLHFPRGVGAVKVVYTAGYTSVPEDLKLAVADMVTYYFKDEHRLMRSLNGASTQYQATSTINDAGFPDHIKRVLDLYRQHG